MLEIPKDFKVSKRAPTKYEINWLYNLLSSEKYNEYKGHKILEFGCGVTSLILNQTLKPAVHVSVEKYEPCINMCKKFIAPFFVVQYWNEIPQDKYDVIFVDSSSGAIKDKYNSSLGRRWLLNKRKPFRDDAIDYSVHFSTSRTIYILHDWNYKWFWLLPREYLDKKGYKLIDSCDVSHGWGIYRKE